MLIFSRRRLVSPNLIIKIKLIIGAIVEDKYSCPHGWTRYGNKKCLKYVNELQDYERAQATCRSKNQGTLVTVHTHEEQNFVYSYIHSIAASSTPIWLGAKQVSSRLMCFQSAFSSNLYVLPTNHLFICTHHSSCHLLFYHGALP